MGEKGSLSCWRCQLLSQAFGIASVTVRLIAQELRRGPASVLTQLRGHPCSHADGRPQHACDDDNDDAPLRLLSLRIST